MDAHQQQKICRKSIKNGPSQLKDFGLVTLGTILITVGVYFFKFPNHFSMGGVSGISVVLGAMLPHFSPGQLVLVINLVLLAVGFLFFGKGFGLKTALFQHFVLPVHRPVGTSGSSIGSPYLPASFGACVCSDAACHRFCYFISCRRLLRRYRRCGNAVKKIYQSPYWKRPDVLRRVHHPIRLFCV